MTTPAMSYYEEIIRRDPKLQEEYILHYWPAFHSPDRIIHFTLRYSTEIYEFREEQLTVRMAPPSPGWEAPEEYLRTVPLPLTQIQLRDLRSVLKGSGFPNLRTDPCSLVNFAGGYLISVHFCCNFPDGRVYHFASQNGGDKLNTLGEFLKNIAEASPEYRQIKQMEKWIFDFKRLERLQQQKKKP